MRRFAAGPLLSPRSAHSHRLPGTLQPDAAVNSLLQRLCQQHQLPGMIAARIEGDQVVRIGAAGIRKAGADERLTIHDQIHLGSCTKALTATMLGCLVQEGRIDWATTVGECLPAMAGRRCILRYQSVTLRQLLTHRAGLPAEDGRIFRTNLEISPTQQRRALFRQLLAEPPRSEPGSRFQYSNLGYMLAGLMAEAVTGESWEQLMQQRLFTPLQMRSAGFGAPGTPGQTDQPWGHRAGSAAGWIAEQADNPAVLGPAGTVHCTCGGLGALPGTSFGTPARSAFAELRHAAGSAHAAARRRLRSGLGCLSAGLGARHGADARRQQHDVVCGCLAGTRATWRY